MCCLSLLLCFREELLALLRSTSLTFRKLFENVIFSPPRKTFFGVWKSSTVM